MNRVGIRNIIIIATILLIGLVFTQVNWVKKAYEIEQKKFSFEVTQVLLKTVHELQKIEGDSSIILDPVIQSKPNFFVVKMHYSSDPFLVESMLKMEFKKESFRDDFVINIYDCFSDSVVYSAQVVMDGDPDEEAVPPIVWNKERGHYFSVFFPEHSGALFYHMEFWIYSSIILVVIIAFFGYLIFQMLRQRRINQIKTDFINNMTHEFKTPISTISIAVEALHKPKVKADVSRLDRYANIIQTENKRLQDQVERILQAATIEKERVAIKKHPVDLHEILDQVYHTFRINVESKNGSIIANLNAQNHTVLGDETHLSNIMNNLVENAVKYSPDTLAIEISTESSGDEITIKIKDQGLGIEKEHQGQIFDKFYRVPTGDVHDVKGFGIGLNYVQLLVKKHQGRIKLTSEKGKGSTFILTFKTLKT